MTKKFANLGAFDTMRVMVPFSEFAVECNEVQKRDGFLISDAGTRIERTNQFCFNIPAGKNTAECIQDGNPALK